MPPIPLMDPAVGNPALSGAGSLPATAHPFITASLPAPVTAYPYETRLGRRTVLLHERCRWRCGHDAANIVAIGRRTGRDDASAERDCQHGNCYEPGCTG